MKQLDKIKAIRLWSENFPGILMTPEAYREVLVEMNDIDYTNHRTETEYVESFECLITVMELNDSLFQPRVSQKVEYIKNVIHVDFVRKVRIA